MGRRAKNKQGAPTPYVDEAEQKPSAKKLGKRKAEDEGVGKGDVKKAKKAATAVQTVEKSGKSKTAKGKEKEKENVGVKATKKPKKDEKKKGKGKQVVEEDEEELDVDMEAGGSSEGWEDVDDGVDLKAEARSVHSSCNF